MDVEIFDSGKKKLRFLKYPDTCWPVWHKNKGEKKKECNIIFIYDGQKPFLVLFSTSRKTYFRSSLLSTGSFRVARCDDRKYVCVRKR